MLSAHIGSPSHFGVSIARRSTPDRDSEFIARPAEQCGIANGGTECKSTRFQRKRLAERIRFCVGETRRSIGRIVGELCNDGRRDSRDCDFSRFAIDTSSPRW